MKLSSYSSSFGISIKTLQSLQVYEQLRRLNPLSLARNSVCYSRKTQSKKFTAWADLLSRYPKMGVFRLFSPPLPLRSQLFWRFHSFNFNYCFSSDFLLKVNISLNAIKYKACFLYPQKTLHLTKNTVVHVHAINFNKNNRYFQKNGIIKKI